jgi:hypothetical protein
LTGDKRRWDDTLLRFQGANFGRVLFEKRPETEFELSVSAAKEPRDFYEKGSGGLDNDNALQYLSANAVR